MKVWQKLITLFLALTVSSVFALENPKDLLEKATNATLEKIVKDKEKYKKDPQALFKLVEENIQPFVDTESIAKRVMGQYYRTATAEQRTEFVRVFKQSLFRTYAKGLTSYENQKVEFKPYKPGPDPKKAQVDMNVYSKAGQVFPVNLQLQLDKQGAWKVQNILIEGINLGLTFRNQFASAVESSNGDIAKAIANWTPDSSIIKDKANEKGK
jgi:phospholipid transport system substrate-binding protein